MIIAVVTFLSAGVPIAGYRGAETFDTRAACEAFLVAEEPGLIAAAAIASARAGRPITFTAACIDTGPTA
jgi:hypothetical protein